MAIDTELGVLLRSLPGILSTFDRGELDELSQYLEEVTLAVGERLWDEGCRGDGKRSIAFVAEGELEAMKETDFPGKHVVLAVLSPGAVVGEVGAFGDNCRAVSAVAVRRSRLAFLDLAALDTLSDANPALAVKLLRGLLKVTAKRLDQSYQRLTSVF